MDSGVTLSSVRESADGHSGILIRLVHSEIASSLVEYGILVGMIALAAVVIIGAFGLEVAGLLSQIGNGFDDGGSNWGGVIN
jgi:Flp pilus assembly pilin Flp